MCFEKMLWGISEMVNARAFKPVVRVFNITKNLLVGISRRSRIGRKPLFKQKCVLEWMLWHVTPQKWWLLELGNLEPLCLRVPDTHLLVGISGALGTNGKSMFISWYTEPIWQTNLLLMIHHCYWHLVVKNGNFSLLLTSSSQEGQFHIATGI